MWLDFKLWFEEWLIDMRNWVRMKRLDYYMWKLERLEKKYFDDKD